MKMYSYKQAITNRPFEVRLSKTGPTNNQKILQTEDTATAKITRVTRRTTSNASLEVDARHIQDGLMAVDDRKNEPGPRKEIEPHKPNQFTRKLYNSYSQNRLMTSGDIETEPGPGSCKLIKSRDAETQPRPNSKKKKTPCLHILSIIILLIVTINKIKKEQDKIQNSLQSPILQQYILYDLTNILLQNPKRDIKKLEPSKTVASHLSILLIIAGDIKLNPGPQQVNKCIQCKKVAQKETAVNCETCNGWSHLQCTESTNHISKISTQSFDWICPNVYCKPNHQTATETILTPTPNRYQILTQKVKEPKKIQTKRPAKKKNVTNNQSPTTDENLFNHLPKIKAKHYIGNKQTQKSTNRKDNHECQTTENLLNQLTKISSDDYIGKEICRACNKTIGKVQKAISCDNCLRWTHLKCSDMTEKTYNACRNTEFPWICNTCRTSEILNQEQFDVNRLIPEQMPLELTSLSPDGPNNFLVLHYNCRSFPSKVEEIHNICRKLNPSIICLTETWLDESVCPDAHVPDGYNIIRQDRSSEFMQKYGKNNGGGVAVLHKRELKIRKIKVNSSPEETLYIEVKAKPNFILGIVYRASYTDLLKENENGTLFEAQLNEVSSNTDKVIVLGDFNCDTEAKNPEKNTNTLLEVFDSLNMKQLIKKPTRIDTELKKATTIDHVWTDPEINLIKESGTIEGISDHTGVFATINTVKEKPEPEMSRFRSYKNYIPQNFNDELKQALEEPLLKDLIKTEQTSEATARWVEIFVNTAAKHAPIKEVIQSKKRKFIPWFTPELEFLIEEKSKRLKLYWLDGLFTDLKIIKSLTNNITHLKRKLKKLYYKEKIQQYDGDPKKTWKILKEVTQTGKKNTQVEPEFLNQDTANIFNTFFATVGTNIQKRLKVKEKQAGQPTQEKFHFKEETEESIIKLIDRIRIDVAVGYDDISARLLKDSKQVIAKTLTQLVNLSYKKATFPTCLKKAIVKAVHKKDCIEEPSNYRPLSILSTVSKIFERSATDQLTNYLEENNLLNETQHAYRKGHSTQTCLSEVVNYIYRENDNGNLVGIASLDLSKAFDSISHSHLIEKLSNFGLGSNSLNWCRTYLKDRKQQTKFKKFISTEETVTSGVPQGSILGPILFIIFTNDLPEKLHNCKIVSYADDTQILVSAKNSKQIQMRIENLINAAQMWYTENSLLNNAGKTEVMLLSTRKTQEIFEVKVTEEGKEKKLKLQDSIKILGIQIDRKLTWNQQVQGINKKAKFAVRNLQRINSLIPVKSRLLLYNSLVASHFNYADIVWGGCNVKNRNKLQRTQNIAVKSILGMSRKESSEEALKKSKLLSLENKRKVHEAVFVYKGLSSKLPAAITRQYQQHLSHVEHRSADRKILVIPKHKTERYKCSPLYRTIKTWNDTPQEIKELGASTFKQKYQTHLQKSTWKP